MEKIVELIKNNKLIEAYLLASKMGLSNEDKYKLFVSEEARKYNEEKSKRTCSTNVSGKTWMEIKNRLFEDCRR